MFEHLLEHPFSLIGSLQPKLCPRGGVLSVKKIHRSGMLPYERLSVLAMILVLACSVTGCYVKKVQIRQENEQQTEERASEAKKDLVYRPVTSEISRRGKKQKGSFSGHETMHTSGRRKTRGEGKRNERTAGARKNQAHVTGWLLQNASLAPE